MIGVVTVKDTAPGHPRGAGSSAVTILVVDPEPAVAHLLATALRFQGYQVHAADTAATAVDVALRVRPHLVICEVALPGADGFTVMARLRACGVGAPVVFLTARRDLTDRLLGLRGGAEDYITKPFALEEVTVRVRAILSRTHPLGESQQPHARARTVGDVRLDERTRQVRRANHLIALTPTEFDLLALLMDNPGVVLSKTVIAKHLWPHHCPTDPRLANVIEAHVSHLRAKIDFSDSAPMLHTLRGQGYQLARRS